MGHVQPGLCALYPVHAPEGSGSMSDHRNNTREDSSNKRPCTWQPILPNEGHSVILHSRTCRLKKSLCSNSLVVHRAEEIEIPYKSLPFSKRGQM